MGPFAMLLTCEIPLIMLISFSQLRLSYRVSTGCLQANSSPVLTFQWRVTTPKPPLPSQPSGRRIGWLPGVCAHVSRSV